MTLSSVVEDEAEGDAAAAADPAHPMPQIDPVISTFPGDRAQCVREDHRIALRQRDDLAARLRPRALFDEQEFAAREIAARPTKENRRLQGEREGAVAVLMQAVISA